MSRTLSAIRYGSCAIVGAALPQLAWFASGKARVVLAVAVWVSFFVYGIACDLAARREGFRVRP